MSAKQRLLTMHPTAAASNEEHLRARAPSSMHETKSLQVYVPGHVVVKFAPWADSRLTAAITRGAGGIRSDVPSNADFQYVTLAPDEDPVSAAARLSRHPAVLYAEPDPIMRPSYRPNDPGYAYQWNFQQIEMEKAWEINPGGSRNVIVAVIDTGVAFENEGAFAKAPDLATTSFVTPYDFVWDDEHPVDMDGHGTHVTGTIAQNTNNGMGVAGIAFNVSIMPVKVLCGEWDVKWGAPFPTGCGGATLARGIRYAVDHGARVLNLSLGGYRESTPLRDALQYAVSKGAVVLIAAGNGALDDNPIEYPAAYSDIEGVLAVAALDYDRNRAYYSSYHDYVEIAAPGGDARDGIDKNHDGYPDGIFQQTLDDTSVAAGVFNQFGYFAYQGTSMATPHVSGLAALLISQGITSPAAIEAAIERFATDLGPAGKDNETGFGEINPRKTLRGLGLAR